MKKFTIWAAGAFAVANVLLIYTVRLHPRLALPATVVGAAIIYIVATYDSCRLSGRSWKDRTWENSVDGVVVAVIFMAVGLVAALAVW